MKKEFRMGKGIVRVLTLLLSLVLLVSAFTGCGSKTNNKENENQIQNSVSNGTTVAEVTTKEVLKPVKLRFFFPGDKKTASDDVWDALGETYKEQLNATYEVNFVPFGDYKDKLILMSASGDDWDMNYDGGWQAYTQMQNKGAYMDLTDILPQYAPDLYAKYQEVGTLVPATINGRVMALPWTLSGNMRPWFNWRSDAAEKAGITIERGSVKTIEDVDRVLHQFKEAYPDQIIFAVGTALLGQVMKIGELKYGYMQTEFHNLYVKADDPTCQLIAAETTPMFREMAKLTRKWVEDKIIASDEMVDKVKDSAKWTTGKVLARTITHEYSFANNSFTDPSFTREYSELYPENKFFNRTPLGNVMAVNKNAANPERSLMFMNMVGTDQSFYDMLFYGIEGTTYVLNGKEAALPEGMTSATSNYLNWPGQWALWKAHFMRPDTIYSEGFWEREAEYAKEPKNIKNPIDGLSYITDDIKNEISRRDQLHGEFGRPLLFGAVKSEDIDKYLDDYIQKSKSAGLDKILEVCQKQVNDYLANKK